MKLDKLFSLRTDFTVIGLTGRTGSGCSRIAEILSSDFNTIKAKGLRNTSEFSDPIFSKKYSICESFLSHGTNWTRFETIKYTDVLLFFIFNKYGGNYPKTKDIFLNNFKENKAENNLQVVNKLMYDIRAIDIKYYELIGKISSIKNFDTLKSEDDLLQLHSLFFREEFKNLANEIFYTLEKYGYFRTRVLFHWVSCNIRSTGDPLLNSSKNIEHIFSIAKLINRLIKAKRVHDFRQKKPTKIVIDSLRNSLEIMFFKERYSAFYMVSTKDVIGNAKDRLEFRLSSKILDAPLRKDTINKLIELDEVEYRTKDFAKGNFSSPDVENCIQKSDFHIFNLKKDGVKEFVDRNFDGNTNGFLTREEQIMKLVALINQPGLITPSSAERAMQIANTAKLNSGCISRKVGAVVTDDSYYVKSVGWNDVAKGHTPCVLRSITDYFEPQDILENNPHYSPFEKGIATETSSYKYKNDKPNNFRDAVIEYFKDSYDANSKDLNGKNCTFCFKTVHNHFEGEANQVHTRSLHAEENAMLQITKLGGTGAKNGFLFTTASPCELCAKKAYQLGITKIFFIDPYPGISVDQILKGGKMDNQPKLIPFYGAIGNAYHELYDGFLSYKDEIAMTLEINPKQKIAKELNNILSKINDPEIKKFINETNLDDREILHLIKETISNYKSQK